MQRPTSITVFGILNIVFAVLGVFGVLATVALFASAATGHNPVIRLMRENPGYAAFLKVTIPLGLIAAVVLLAAGIGLLLLKPWARVTSIGYAIYTIAMGIIGMAVNVVFVVRPLLAEAAQAQGPEAAGAIGGAIGGSIGGCLGLIYPILLLVFMTRPKVAAAFRPAQPDFTAAAG